MRPNFASLAVMAILTVALYATHPAYAGQLCECGAFNFQTEDEVAGTMVPLISQNPMNTTCDEDGAKQCLQICIELVKLGKERAPEILCSHLKHSDGIKPSLYTRTCDGAWKYSGLTCEHMICCHDSQTVPCDKSMQ